MDWKNTLNSIAPTIATALGGPLAGAATKFIGDKLLGNENASEQDISDAVLSASSADLAKLKQMDLEFKAEMKKLDVDVFEIEAKDKQDARKNHKRSNMPAILSIGLTVIVCVIVFLLFWLEPPEGAREVLYMLLGMVLKEWGGSMQYWFGTTRSSSDKTELIKGSK
jgi:hypothetical protein